MLSIQEQIEINRHAQIESDRSAWTTWFDGFRPESKGEVLDLLIKMVIQARTTEMDCAEAVRVSGVTVSRPAARTVLRGATYTNLNTLKNLDLAGQRDGSYILLCAFRLADDRRRVRDGCKPETERHWWHLDLCNQEVVDNILKDYREGNL